jgi:predicted AlkP superfamily pyrophosphatase or phosphodiesterase
MIARLVEQERANDPAAAIVIVSDHGFADITQFVNLGAAFIDAGLMQPPAPDAAWQAQPWALGAMFAIMLHDAADGAVKQKVRALLQKLAADPANGIEAVLDAAQVAAAGGAPEASFVVTLRKGFAPGGNLSGALVTPIPGHRGTHGYNPATTPEMRSAFFAAGPGIARGKNIGIVDMRGIAPAVAHLLGVELPAAKQAPLPLQ